MKNCYLCEKTYIPKENFELYLCFDCHSHTSFCLNCDKLMMKIFENLNMFKCGSCKKIVPAITKQLIEAPNSLDDNQNNNNNMNDNNLSPNKNMNYENINNFSNLSSPIEPKYLYPSIGNRIAIYTPSINSSFLSELKINNNNSVQKTFDSPFNNNNNKNNNNSSSNIQIQKENYNNLSCLTDNTNINTKNKKEFHLRTNNNGMTLVKNKPKKIIDYFHENDSKEIEELNNNNSNDNKNKSIFIGYNKKSKKK